MKTELLPSLLFSQSKSDLRVARNFGFYFLLLTFNFLPASGQVPQGFNYQAAARDGANPITTPVSVRITIQSESEGGTVFWFEEHPPVTTNESGLFTLVIGKGSRISGLDSFSDIDWSISPKYIKTEIDYNGWKTMGSALLWTVPYSMVAKDLGGPVEKLGITGTTLDMEEALFEVKNKDNKTVFAVYNEGVRVYVDDGVGKSSKGGFAIGGLSAKGAQDYFVVNSDSIRAYIDTNSFKGRKGGFAIGGFGASKTPVQEYMRVTSDSTRISMREISKGKKGGFAIGGFGSSKATTTSFTSLTPENYFIGHEAGISNTTGLYNSFFGYQAGRSNTEGAYNIFIGRKSGYSNIGGWTNLFIGDSAGYNNTSGYNNLFLGYGAGMSNTDGNLNASLGMYAGAYNTSGWQNINLGYMAGFSTTIGNRNIFVGAGAGQSNIEGQANVMVGNLAGAGCTMGRNNVYIGAYAGRRDTLGSYNVFIGSNAGQGASSSNTLIIANNNIWPLIYGEFDNGRVVINGDSTSNIFKRTFQVDGDAGGMSAWFNDSDRKLKHDIVTIPDALQKVLKMRGVNFLWNNPKEGMDGLQMGFIGQEAADVVPEVVTVRDDHYSMQYAPVTALLVEAIKEQQKQIDELKALVAALAADK